MALASPLFTVDTTSQDGTGTYSLDDPASPGDGLRTLADAVSMGVLSDGDTVEYVVRDKTKEGTALLYEAGIGTVGSGSTLTRDTILQNHLGTTAEVSWPSGGSRSVAVALAPTNVCRTANNLSDVDDADTAADNIGAARLNASNVFAARQEIKDDAARLLKIWRDSVTSGDTADLLFAVTTADYSKAGVFFERDGSSFGRGDLILAVNDVATTDTVTKADAVMTLTHEGSVLDASGNTYEAFPSGFAMLAESVPTGWTRDDNAQSRLIRLAKSGETLGSEGGGDDVFSSWATQGHSLSIAELAEHDHIVFHGTTVVESGAAVVTGRVLSTTGADDQTTSTTGSGTAHAHNLTTPYHRIMARIVKS